jgi:DNA mismatch repair protein MutS2
VIPLGKNGNIIKISDSQKEIFEILVGIVKVRASHEELRLIQKLSPPKPKVAVKQKSLTTASSQDKLVFQTASNTCNLRGLSGDDAVARSLKFIDNLVLKGEEAAVLVHGLGTSAVKHALRKELKESCAYSIYFRPGQPEEGGDAVTIVFIKD